ncbi:4'-phosphopantetheinyl transferase superfamily protein [Flavobacteriaceae bacterium]|nr:4'-phosphopantetheinyl transferase superfamily protein [Flavobacteriaceae bacterium]
MIGNDVIDLSLAKTQSNWQRKGFLKKLFSNDEQQLILEALNSFEMVWRLWSMKEAAYKIFTQQHSVRFFAPKKFECKLMQDLKGVVCYKGQQFYTSSIINQHYIFTTAVIENKKSPYSEMVSPDQIDTMIKSKLNELTALEISEIQQKKSKNGVPSYYYKTTLLTSSCSITHHGKFGAYSFLQS